jgi:thymidylate synthase (FAD)
LVGSFMDALDLVPNKKIECLDLGFVELVDVMPRIVPDGQTCDYAICQMARTSYGSGTKTINEDKGLINYLLRAAHTSPFESIEIKLHMRLPIFVARQMIRHRSSSLNEISARYSVMEDNFYIPKPQELRAQSSTNKQGSEGKIDDIQASVFSSAIEAQAKSSYELYARMIEAGVAREQARMVLPVNLYTEWYWKQDLHNLMHLMALRCDHHAQYEIQVYGNAILEIVRHLCPWTIEAWEKYHPMRGAMKLTSLEKNAIKKYNSDKSSLSLVGRIDTENKREQNEWIEKAKTLGFEI